VEVILTFASFHPGLYEASLFGKWETLLLMNPVGAILSVNAVVVLHRPPNYFWMHMRLLGNRIVSHQLEYLCGWNIPSRRTYSYGDVAIDFAVYKNSSWEI
jgi:hypothetical protein